MTREPDALDSSLARYAKQVRFGEIGERGQRRLGTSQAVVIGCGALGTVLAQTLVRSGVGAVRIVDRDFIELDNLQRQVLFDERDLADNLPKAEAAARKLRKINSAVEIEGIVADANPDNIERFCRGADVLLDGTDNFETRFLLNDAACKLDIPWVYGAVIGAEGVVMPIIPRETPCLRCIWEEAPGPGTSPTCDTAGVLASAVAVVASMQALEAMKLLAGRADALVRRYVTIDLWAGRFRALDMQPARERGDCPCCKHGRYEFLSGEKTAGSARLCGRNAVHLTPAREPDSPLDLRRIASGLPSGSRPRQNEYMLRFEARELEITLFPDGRAIVKGTEDAAAARTVYAKYVGA